MDLDQNKLSRQEWNNLETKVSNEEQVILNILDKGYENNDISINKNFLWSLFIPFSLRY